MTQKKGRPAWSILGLLFRAHPWHGVEIGPDAPELINTYIEMVPTESVKYELDKVTGLLRIDRPQLYSSVCPALYGLVPRTFCGERVAELCARRTGVKGVVGDGDPLDICVLTEKQLSHGDIIVRAIPIGGLRLLDEREADDKIIAVMESDATYGSWHDISECPDSVRERLEHYFLTYKEAPGTSGTHCRLAAVYGREEAHDVIRRSQEDYEARFGNIDALLDAALKEEKG